MPNNKQNSGEILVNKVPYYLPLTLIHIKGTRTTKKPIGEDPTVTSEVTVDLVTTADPNNPRCIIEADSLLADQQLAIELTEKGLLISTNASSSGKLGAIITNIFGAVLRFGLFFGVRERPFGFFEEETIGRGLSPVEEAYKKSYPDLSDARLAAKKAVANLIKKAAEISKVLPDCPDLEELKKKRSALQELYAALKDIKIEAKALEEHFTAWKTGELKTEVELRECMVDLSELPKEDDVIKLKELTEDEMKSKLPAKLKDIFWDMRAIVADNKCVKDIREIIDKFPQNDGRPLFEKREDARGVEFRLPRPTVLSLFEIHERHNGDSGKYDAVLKERREVFVSDDKCITAMMRIKGGMWSDKSLDMDFAKTGSLQKITTNAKSELAGFAEALSKLPPEILQSLKDTNALVDERQKLALQGIEERIEELKKEKEEALARIALNETLATEDQAAEIKNLEQEISLLEKQKRLEQLALTKDSDTKLKLLEIEEELVKARTALETAEIERLKIQEELKKIQIPGPESGPEK